MKVNRFNAINEAMTKDVKEFVGSFSDSTDGGILCWIDDVKSNTKLKYPNFSFAPTKRTIEFANQNNLKNLLNFFNIDKEIEQKEKEIEKLKFKKDKLFIEAENELMYKFQEDLINNDFDSFKSLFIDIEDITAHIGDVPTEEEILKYAEIHPKILKNHKEKILINITANKYNI